MIQLGIIGAGVMGRTLLRGLFEARLLAPGQAWAAAHSQETCDDVAAELGVPCVRTLHEIDRPIDLVDVFRRAEFTPQHAREAVEVGAGALWLQLGIVSEASRRIAEDAGVDYVEDLCTAIVHRYEVRERTSGP